MQPIAIFWDNVMYFSVSPTNHNYSHFISIQNSNKTLNKFIFIYTSELTKYTLIYSLFTHSGIVLTDQIDEIIL